MNSKEYKKIYGKDAPVKCARMRRNLRGKNNPAYNHGGKFSPFSKKFIHYTNDEDIRKLHEKAEQTRIKNNSHVFKVEYWLEEANGDWEEAKKLRDKNRTLFSLDYCIEKYGEKEGRKIWRDRQRRWQKTLKSKSPEELEEINRKKSNQMNIRRLWKNENGGDGVFYVLDIGDGMYKIGITTQDIKKRYALTDHQYKIIREFPDKITNCFMVEQLIKKFYYDLNIDKEEAIEDFGWTETFKFPNINKVLTELDEMFNDITNTLDTFINTFDLKHEEKFIG